MMEDVKKVGMTFAIDYKKIMRKLFFIITFLSIIFISGAQTWSWARGSKSVGGSGDEGYSVCADVSGNSFAAGEFSGSKIIFGTYTLTSSGNYDAYLTKYDPNGNILWAKNVGGTSNEEASGVAVDKAGNSYLAGGFDSPNIICGTTTLTSSTNGNFSIVKYDPSGNILWAKSGDYFSGSFAYAVSVDTLDNIFVTGVFTGTTMVVGTYTLNNPAGVNTFIVKYDSNGNVLWAKNSVGSLSAYSTSISSDLIGNTFITGFFNSSTLSFGTYTLTKTGSLDVFITKYDPNGNVLWAKSSVGTSGDNCYAVSADPFGNAYITGFFQSTTISFGTYTLTNAGGLRAFLVKYDPNGNTLWAKSFNGTNNTGYSLSAYNGGVFTSGGFIGNFAIGTLTVIPPASSTDPMYIAQFDPNGNLVFVTSLGSGGDDQSSVYFDKSCNLFVSGDFESNPFNVGSTSLSLTGTENIFTAKLSYTCSPLNIDNSKYNNEFLVYPNPSNGSFNIQINNSVNNCEIILLNSLGQKVHEQKISQRENNIVTHDLTKGLYHYIILKDKEQIGYGKLGIE